MTVRIAAVLLAWLGVASTAGAQFLPSGPLVFADGRVAVGGDISASIAPDDPGFFNYTDYEHSTLRLLRLDVTASARAGAHVTLLGEVRTENVGEVRPYAFYVRLRPWASRNLDIQVGRIPPTFGAFARRSYAADNPLIGYPLAYQYLTSLRADALPATTDELLKMRGRGWLSNFSVGDPGADRGVPLVSAFNWDTGVQVHAEHGWLEGAAAITVGTLARPLFRDDNAGRQIVGRVALRPVAGLVIGASAARGPFVSSDAARAASAGRHAGDFTQAAWGTDVEYSRGHYLLRAETVLSEWTLPAIAAPFIGAPLRSLAASVEGRYRLAPGLYAAGRVDHLGFSEIAGTAGTNSWDAPVTRVELGGGYSLLRNLLVKVAIQHDTRDGGRVPTLTLGAVQMVFWF